MKKSLIVLVISGLTMFSWAGTVDLSAAAVEPQQLLTGILNKMDKAHQDLKTLRAEIAQQKTNAQIGVSDNEYGSLIYKPSSGRSKGKLRIDYTRPSRDTISLVGDSVVYYQPRINQVFKSTIAKAAKGKVGGFTQLIGLDGSVKSLAGNYHIEFLRDEAVNGQMTTLLRLTPKSGGQFTTIDIWVNQQNWIPAQWRLVERNGDFTIVSLKNIQLNSPIPDTAFNVTIPGGVKVVDKI